MAAGVVLRQGGAAIQWGDDFGADEETLLASRFERPLLVTHFPASFKAFYMQPAPGNPELVLGLDLLAPEGYGEIIGGGQREADLATLEAAIDHHKLPREAFGWYLDLRRYGTFPHAGFGLGIERSVAWISSSVCESIDDVASSRINTRGSVMIARANATR